MYISTITSEKSSQDNRVLSCFTRRALVIFAHIINVNLRLRYFPKKWNSTDVILEPNHGESKIFSQQLSTHLAFVSNKQKIYCWQNPTTHTRAQQPTGRAFWIQITTLHSISHDTIARERPWWGIRQSMARELHL